MTNFTPGPSQLYFTVQDHIKSALREGIPSLSHRSKAFEAIYRNTASGLKSLLNIPDHFTLVFTASATEIWERSIQNLVHTHSAHLVNGAFSKRYWEISKQLNKQAVAIKVPEGTAPAFPVLDPLTELIAVTHNETSTGVSLSPDFIRELRTAYPSAIIAVDAVSSLPYPAFDFSQLDCVFFSVQKGFGLPAGLGVWLVNERCVAKAENLLAQGNSIGSYHTLPQLIQFARKNQTPETPNVLGIYLLSKVIEDFNRRGIDMIRRETEYKSAILYQALDQHPLIHAFVQQPEHRSRTVIVASTGAHTTRLSGFLSQKGLAAGDGYGPSKSSQLRFANFPAHSKEQYEALVDALQEFH
jgi:phosphoserine aminotransferase